MSVSFEVLPFGRLAAAGAARGGMEGEMEGEMERGRMPPGRGGAGRHGHLAPPRAGHVPFRARHGRRRYFAPPWPYYYGPYGPGWVYGGPSTVNLYGDAVDSGGAGGGDGADGDAGPGFDDDAPQGEYRSSCGCNCPKCRQRATAFEVLPFG